MKIPIVLICDDNYIVPTSVAISSMIASKRPDTYYEIYIVCASLSEESEKAFSVFASDSVAIHVIRENADRFVGLHQFSGTAVCVASPAALLKFILPELLPQYDKVLYLDGDILVRTDLSELYATDLEDNFVAAVIDSGSIYYKHRFVLLVEHYFNSGVMVLNLKQMRQENMTETLIRTKQELKDSNLMDQNVLNIVFDHRVKCLPIWWNFLGINLQRARKKWELSDVNEQYGTQFQSREELFDSWKILHFSSKDKPWKNPFVLFADKWIEVYRALPDQCRHIGADPEQTAVSVIAAVHDNEEYLRESLDSILLQTLGKIEVLCIAEDVSDGIVDILRQYERQDHRISVIGGGLGFGTACGSALAQAKGKYVFFLDDYMILPLDGLKMAWLTAEEHQADVTLLDGKKYNDRNRAIEEKSEFLARKLLPQQPVFSPADAPNTLFTISRPVMWDKLFSRHFLLSTGLQFSNLSDFDDLYSASVAMMQAEGIAPADGTLFYYRVNCGRKPQQKREKEPLSFLFTIDNLYRELTQRGRYEALQTAFRHLALSEVISRLRDGRKNETRLRVLETLTSEPFCRIPLLEVPEADGDNSTVHWYSAQVTAAFDWYCQSQRISVLAAESGNDWYKNATAPGGAMVSVIIPVYNAGLYLEDTLACIAGQTLSDIEIICVNDGSTDDSLEILERWAAKDHRFVILSQPNSRQGYARNVGIRHARGKYLYFMDSDDLLERNALEELMATMEEKQLECLYFDGSTIFDDRDLAEEFARFESNYIRSRSYDDVYDGPTLLRLFCEENSFIPSPCLQMLRTDFVRENRLMYPVGVIYEDNAFTFAVLLHAKRASHVQRAYFVRRIHKDSTMTAEITFQNVYGAYIVFLDMVRTFYKVADSLSEENRGAAVGRIVVMLRSAQSYHAAMPSEYENSELGLRGNLFAFQSLICDGGRRQIRKLDGRLRRAYTENARLNDRYNQHRSDKIALDERYKRLRDDKIALDAKYKRVRDDKIALDGKYKQLRDEKIALDGKYKQLRDEKIALDAKYKQLRDEKIALDGKYKQLRDDKIALDAKYKRVRDEKIALEAQYKQLRDEKRRLEARNKRLRSEKAEQDKKCECLNEEIRRLNAEVSGLKRRQKELEGSRAYRLGRLLTAPLRLVRRLWKKIKKGKTKK